MLDNPKSFDVAELKQCTVGTLILHPRQLPAKLLRAIPVGEGKDSKRLQGNVVDAARRGANPGSILDSLDSSLPPVQSISTPEGDQWLQRVTVNFHPNGQLRHQEDRKVHGLCLLALQSFEE